MLQVAKQTNRKFYNKWLYKVTLRLAGCSILRTKSLSDIKDFCKNGDPDEVKWSISSRAYANKEHIYDLVCFLESYSTDIYSKRIERDLIDFYTNDNNMYQSLSDQFSVFLIHKFEPDPATIDLLNESNSQVAVKKLPHNRYRYRVYLLPHKMKGDVEAKEKYIGWLKNQSPRITCTTAVSNWFIKTDWNWDRRYVLVEDEATLLMLKLRNAEVVGRIYNYVVSDK